MTEERCKEVKKSKLKDDRSLAGWTDIIEKAISQAIGLYKKYRHNRSLLLDEKRYVMEAFWKYLEKEKENSMRFEDWLFDYYLSKFEEAC